jgi:glycerate dehydrogenase
VCEIRTMKIVVLDGHAVNPGDNPWEGLARLGELIVYDRTPADAVIARAADAEIVLTNKTELRAAALAALPRLRFIAVLATGFNIVDIAAARAGGIAVSNVPEYGTASVAQHTLALLLELANRVGDHARAVAAGHWVRAPDFSFWLTPPRDLSGCTLGLVGYGRIGQRVAVLARALGMRVLAATSGRGPRADTRDVGWRSTADLFAEADAVSLHVPLTRETAGLVNAAVLARMKPTAFVINTARGGLIDEPALAAALNGGEIAGAALDVLSSEPPRADNPLLSARNCLITPHIAWASLAARRALMRATEENVAAFLAGAPINVVNA